LLNKIITIIYTCPDLLFGVITNQVHVVPILIIWFMLVS